LRSPSTHRAHEADVAMAAKSVDTACHHRNLSNRPRIKLASPIRSPLPGHLKTLCQPLSMDATWPSYLHHHPPSPCSELGYINRAPTSQPPSNFFTAASGGLTSNHIALQGRGRREEEKGKSNKEELDCRRSSGHRTRRRCCLLPCRKVSLHGRSTSLPRITTTLLSFCHEPEVSHSTHNSPLLTTVSTLMLSWPKLYQGQPRPRPDLRSRSQSITSTHWSTTQLCGAIPVRERRHHEGALSMTAMARAWPWRGRSS
jgi:hypothetical protein